MLAEAAEGKHEPATAPWSFRGSYVVATSLRVAAQAPVRPAPAIALLVRMMTVSCKFPPRVCVPRRP